MALSRMGFLVNDTILKECFQGGCHKAFLRVETSHAAHLLYFVDLVQTPQRFQHFLSWDLDPLDVRVGKSTDSKNQRAIGVQLVQAAATVHEWQRVPISWALLLLPHSSWISELARMVRGRLEGKAIQRTIGHGKAARKAKKPFGKWKAME